MRGRQRARSRQIITAGGVAPGIISDATNIPFAVGMRKLITGYNGPCCTVRRVSDNVELDLNFVAATGEVDVAAANTFRGASTIRIKTWYDQTGNGRHVSAATGNKQPIFTSSESGVGNKAVATFNYATATSLIGSAWGTSYTDQIAHFLVFYNNKNLGIAAETSTATGSRLETGDTSGGVTHASYFGSSYRNGPAGSGPFVWAAIGNGTSDAIYVNDKTTAYSTGSAGTPTMDGACIGDYFNISGSYSMTGYVRNVVFYQALPTSDVRQQIMQALADDSSIVIA